MVVQVSYLISGFCLTSLFVSKFNSLFFVCVVFLENTDPISYTGGLLEAYENLSKRLRTLDDIPLRVSSVQPLDSGFISLLSVVSWFIS